MLPAMGDHPLLFLPGPTEVDASLLAIMATPLCGHRDPRFVATVRSVCDDLRWLYGTAAHAAFETCPATALMEAAIRNLVPAGGRTLHLVGGAFGERWHHIARSCGRAAEALPVPHGHAHLPALLRERLQQGPPVAAIAITHNETSTGVLQPLRELAAVARASAPDALLLVDVVTSLAGAELQFDDWELDFAFAGTQKCLALPPGLCTYAVSPRALATAATVPDRGFLLDLPLAVTETSAGRTLATPCVPLVLALAAQLRRIRTEGLPARWQRHLAMRDAVLAFAERAGMRAFVSVPEHRSPTVSCLDANGQDVAAMVQRAAAAGYAIDPGYGPLKGKTLRIGHMGDHQPATVARLLAALHA